MLKTKKESKSKVNVAMVNGNDSDSSIFSLSIIPTVCCSEKSKWILDTVLPITFVPNESSFLVLKN